MITTECPNCGNAVPVFAASCGVCGASNRARLGAFAVAGLLTILLVAIVIAAAIMVSRAPAPGGAPDDFAWLSKAMDECDAEAEKAPATLYFLVVPMASAPNDDAYWRSKSLNDVGNAILLRQRETIDALVNQRLRIATEKYEFNVRDEATSAIHRWSPSVGVKKFLITNAEQIREFKAQFKTGRKAETSEWGSAFTHRQGTCYWVNAIIGY